MYKHLLVCRHSPDATERAEGRRECRSNQPNCTAYGSTWRIDYRGR